MVCNMHSVSTQPKCTTYEWRFKKKEMWMKIRKCWIHVADLAAFVGNKTELTSWVWDHFRWRVSNLKPSVSFPRDASWSLDIYSIFIFFFQTKLQVSETVAKNFIYIFFANLQPLVICFKLTGGQDDDKGYIPGGNIWSKSFYLCIPLGPTCLSKWGPANSSIPIAHVLFTRKISPLLSQRKQSLGVRVLRWIVNPKWDPLILLQTG